MLHESQVAGWPGRTMFDRDGSKVGTIEDVFADERTGDPAWVTVSSGLFGRKHHFVPIAHAREVEDGVAVPLDGALVKDAPRVDQDGDLTAEDESVLYRHYGMADEDPTSGATTGEDHDRDRHGVGAKGLAGRGRHDDGDRHDIDDRLGDDDRHDDRERLDDHGQGRTADLRDRHDDRAGTDRDVDGDDHADDRNLDGRGDGYADGDDRLDRDEDRDGSGAGLGGAAAVGGATAAGVAGTRGEEPELRDREAAEAEAAGERAVIVARERREREEREAAERRDAGEHAGADRARPDDERSRFQEAAARSKAAFLENRAAAEREGRPGHEAEHAAREASAVPYDEQPLDRDRGHEDLGGGPLDRDRAHEDLDAGSADVASPRHDETPTRVSGRGDDRDLLPQRDATGDADPAPGDGLSGATDHGPPVPDARFVGRPHVDDDHRVQRDRVIDPTGGAPETREHRDAELDAPAADGTGPQRARPGAGTRLRRLVRSITPDKDDHHG